MERCHCTNLPVTYHTNHKQPTNKTNYCLLIKVMHYFQVFFITYEDNVIKLTWLINLYMGEEVNFLFSIRQSIFTEKHV